MKNIFVIGAKNIGQYGGFETFLDKLTYQHKNKKEFNYYIITKENGDGYMDETKLNGVRKINDHSFVYNNARITKIKVPQMGAAQAVAYDIKAFNYCIKYCRKKNISNPIIYVLACRIGPFFERFVRRVHELNGVVYVNPDGHEWKRDKWNYFVKKYWKLSEKLMVKYADLMVCDSVNIEKYINDEYKKYNPRTTYIAYGSDIRESKLNDDDPIFTGWLKENSLAVGEYYMCCGRFVPENSFDVMIREFMQSNSKRPFVIITTKNDELMNKLENTYHFSKDTRIKFVGTVYDGELLKKIRENAFANIHGHTVGGTNPSLLEALGSTDVNLLIGVEFNREVAGNSALYWRSDKGRLAKLIDQVDKMSKRECEDWGKKAKKRISDSYSWEFIADQYEKLWEKGE